MKLSIKELKTRLAELDEERKIILAEITIAESAEATLLNQNNSILLPKLNAEYAIFINSKNSIQK